MRALRIPVAAGVLLTAAAALCSGVFGPGPNSQTIPSTGQNLSVIISSPADNSTVPIPPGSVQVTGNCSIGSVAGNPINVLYVLDVSGSTDLNFMIDNHIPLVDANGNGTAGDAGDDFNGDGEKGETLDGEIAGVLALHTSIGNPSNVNVGVLAFATHASSADVDPAPPNVLPISQFFTTPPQADRDGAGGADIPQVLRSLTSEQNSPSGGKIGKFTLVGQSILGNNTHFDEALQGLNAALLHFPSPATNIVFFLSDGASNASHRCFQGACASQLATAVAAHTKINTVGVGTGADPVDLAYIAAQTGGTFVPVTNPNTLSTVLPSITPAGLDRVEVNATVLPIDGLGNFSATINCANTAPFTVTARCFANDPTTTSVAADIMLQCFRLCGNGTVQPGAGEECEPPNTSTCDANCQRVPQCGDGFVDAPEQCDPPDGVSCNTACRTISCGDGLVQGHEECEPPNTSTCDANCQRVPRCGDGFIDAPEQCDPPNGTTCDTDCTPIVCGNGDVEPGEECEPPNTATCAANCQRVPVCGDGFIDTPELCDPPNGATCDTDCRPIVCGNGDVEPGEECEPPNTATCAANCQRVPSCGDGFIDAPEQCEPPGSINCNSTCRLIGCGDGDLGPGEECEPPNTATCDASCQRIPLCGDGFIDPPAEQCEPPNTGNCNASCRFRELCLNEIDDDGDGLIDCKDPDCPPCAVLKRDPAYIVYDRKGNHRDSLRLHAQFQLFSPIDPPNEEVGIVLTNPNGIIFRATIPIGSMVDTGKTPGVKYTFIDRSGATADNVVRLKIFKRTTLWRFNFKAYADLSAATGPEMTLGWRVGDDVFTYSDRWTNTVKGWFLPLR